MASTSLEPARGRRRRRRLWRVDRARAGPARRAGDPDRRVGTRQRARELRRRDTRHPRHLRHADGLLAPRRSGPLSAGASTIASSAPDCCGMTGVLWMFQRDAGLRGRVDRGGSGARSSRSKSSAPRRAVDFRRSISTGSSRRSWNPRPAISSPAAPASMSSNESSPRAEQYLPAAVASPSGSARRPQIPLLDRRRSRPTLSCSPVAPGSARCFRTSSAGDHADAPGRLLRRDAAGDRRFTTMDCRSGSTSAGASCMGSPAMRIAGSRSPTIRAGRASIRRPDRGSLSARTGAGAAFLARRFPALARAPLLGSEVCQYEATPDSDYIVDRHPGAPNAWIVGGGSGHGFKMGPVIGEMVASAVLGRRARPGVFTCAPRAVQRADQKWT